MPFFVQKRTSGKVKDARRHFVLESLDRLPDLLNGSLDGSNERLDDLGNGNSEPSCRTEPPRPPNGLLQLLKIDSRSLKSALNSFRRFSLQREEKKEK